MKIKITGINGYLGQLLAAHFRAKGDKVVGIDRKLLYGDPKYLMEEISHADAIINLAGSSILTRWTKRNMRKIYKSRIITTKNLVNAINLLPEEERPKKIVTASAIGIYANGVSHDESSKRFDSGFVGKVVKDWEAAFDELPHHTELKICRIGLVIGKNAKTIKNLLFPFRMGLGGKVGSGKQTFPYVHDKDATRAFDFVLSKPSNHKTFNIVSPEVITNEEFTKELAHQLQRPAFMTVPSVLLKIVLGKASTLLLESPTVYPKALEESGFQFEFTHIKQALEDIVN